MKELHRNLRIIVTLFLCLFVAVAGFFSYKVYFYGGRWLGNAYNPRLKSSRDSIRMGSVLDRNGVTLASTSGDGDRVYPSDELLRRSVAHVVGDDLGIVSTGVQTFHAGDLYGMNGGVFDRISSLFTSSQPRGNDVVLTLDSGLQKYASTRFPDGEKGVVVVLNYKTGEVLAMVNKPEFDLSTLTRKSAAKMADGAFLNRATQGQYAPGSIFKVVTAASALTKLPGIESRSFTCDGIVDLTPERTLSCYHKTVHGELNFEQAFAKSCNITFGTVGMELGMRNIRSTAKQLGFDDDFLFRDLIMHSSKFPTENPEADEVAWTAVGQGKTLVTPMHMALLAGAVGNGGVMMEPYVTKQVQTPRKSVVSWTSAKAYKRVFDAAMAEKLDEYMRQVTKNGTGSRAAVKGVTVNGKTGTAEVGGNKGSHAWYIGYVKEAEHPLAICVLVENGGAGGSVAAPLAAKVLAKAIDLGY